MGDEEALAQRTPLLDEAFSLCSQVIRIGESCPSLKGLGQANLLMSVILRERGQEAEAQAYLAKGT